MDFNCEYNFSSGFGIGGCPWNVDVDESKVIDNEFYAVASRPLDAQHVLKDGMKIQIGGGYTISAYYVIETTLVDEFKRPNMDQVFQIEIVRNIVDNALLGIAGASSVLLSLSLF